MQDKRWSTMKYGILTAAILLGLTPIVTVQKASGGDWVFTPYSFSEGEDNFTEWYPHRSTAWTWTDAEAHATASRVIGIFSDMDHKTDEATNCFVWL